jgi:hypothetical protein
MRKKIVWVMMLLVLVEVGLACGQHITYDQKMIEKEPEQVSGRLLLS